MNIPGTLDSGSLLPQLERMGGEAAIAAIPGVGPALAGAGSILGLGSGNSQQSSISSFLGPNFAARFITGLVGLILVAAAIFTHPTVINVGKKTARAAGRAAELAAA